MQTQQQVSVSARRRRPHGRIHRRGFMILLSSLALPMLSAGADPAQAVEYFPSEAFLQGFRVSPPMIAREIPEADFGRLAPMDPSATEPFWTLMQWYCVESLAEDHRAVAEERRSVWRNPYEALEVSIGDDGRPVMSMTLDALAVYDHMALTCEKMGHVRPHFLLGRQFYPNLSDGIQRYGGAEETNTLPDGSTFPDLDTFQELTLSVDLRVVEATDLRQEYKHDDAANRRRHYNRACFQYWLQLYCRDAARAEHGRFFWLGYRAYDGEVPYASPIPHQVDQIESDGKSTHAYRLCDQSIYGDDYARKLKAFHDGKETTMVIDVLAAARKAIRALQDEKNDFLDATEDLAGYTIMSFNMGWEPACPFRGTMAIRNLSLRGTPK